MQPVVHELEYICFGILPPRHLNVVGNIAVALLETRRVACVHLEHPRLWRRLLDLIAVLDGELRLSVLR